MCQYKVKIVEWFLYLSLCGISFIFTRTVFEQFQSKATGFLQKGEPILENPTITFCFEENNLNLEFGKNFNITLGNKVGTRANGLNQKSVPLSVGDTFYRNDTSKVVRVEKILNEEDFTCYKITPDFLILGQWVYHIIKFDPTLDQNKLPTVHAHVTSENNSYGMVKEFWLDGKQLSYILRPGFKSKQKIVVSPEKIIRLEVHSKCRKEPFYECYGNYLLVEVAYGNCSKCFFQTLPPKVLSKGKICKTKEEIECAKAIENLAWWNLPKGKCGMPCTLLQYIERSQVRYHEGNHHKVSFYYMISNVDEVVVKEEYVIYDIIGMIGAVGGTLGLFIGFSIFDFSLSLFGYLQKLSFLFNRQK